MSAPRKDLEDLKLSATSSNLARALKIREAEAEVELTDEQKNEVDQLDALIQKAIKACRKGSTFNKRRNPAFQNLESLVKTRDLILKRNKKKDGEKKKSSFGDFIGDSDATTAPN